MRICESCNLLTFVSFLDVKNAFDIVDGKNTYYMMAESPAEKEAWIRDLKTMKKEIQKRQYEEQFGISLSLSFSVLFSLSL